MFPIAAQVGPVTVFSFGLLLGIAFLIFTFLVFKAVRNQYLDEEKVFDVIFLSTLSGIIGSRAFYIIEHFDSFGFNILNWILINAKPGFSFWGGVGVSLAVFLITTRNRNLPEFKLLDIFVPGFGVLATFGYFGAFLAGVDVGKPTTLPWGVVTFSTLKRHPVDLYQALASLLVLLIILRLKKIVEGKKLPAGVLFSIFLLLESCVLFLIAFLKEHDIVIAPILSNEQFMYLLVFVVSLCLLYIRLGRNIRNDSKKIQFMLINRFTRKEKKNEKIS